VKLAHVNFETNESNGVTLSASVTLQAMRQTACTTAIEKGMPLLDYTQIFGHSLVTAQRHYIKFGRSSARHEAMKATDFSGMEKQSVTPTVKPISQQA
jgi:hypothetical protein